MKRNLRYATAAGLAGLGLAAALALSGAGQPPAQPAFIAAAAPPAATATHWFDGRINIGGPDQSARDGAPDASAAAVYGRHGRAIDFGGLTVAQYIAPRIAAARMGDMKAAYAVYQAIAVCAALDEAAADYQEPSQLAQFQREREEQQRLCATISPAQVQERMQFLSSAARAGIRDAQIDFYMEGPGGKPVQQNDGASDPLLAQWQADALTFLKSAGAQCDPFALGLLSNAYDAGDLAARTPRLAVAYGVAAAAARHVGLNRQQLLNRFGDQVSDAELDEGMRLGAQLAQESCK
ncbi:MAG: hypothetical protein V4578_01510 [Pseudomonadota bacterium]